MGFLLLSMLFHLLWKSAIYKLFMFVREIETDRKKTLFDWNWCMGIPLGFPDLSRMCLDPIFVGKFLEFWFSELFKSCGCIQVSGAVKEGKREVCEKSRRVEGRTLPPGCILPSGFLTPLKTACIPDQGKTKPNFSKTLPKLWPFFSSKQSKRLWVHADVSCARTQFFQIFFLKYMGERK